ncbi:MAG: bifunctional precorrin-2 dehydrogenase/sirohydrochlorin ferrochelatase [Fibromonadales bacterium]|nr:bifunctional precorrin-2 dehydrogenase/sirohydrochlorin ferrochelatase [Fibromonadales bacterium]
MKTFFPLFIDMNGRRVLVVGGGKVAERRIKILIGFGAEITVISPSVTEYIENAASMNSIRLIKRKYKKGDVGSLIPFLVIAATDERQANHEAMAEAKELNINVSVADCHEECSCYFPAIADSDAYITGLVSKNGKHAGVKEMIKKIREVLSQ